MVYFLMATGFEEAEALVPFDYLKRAGLDCRFVSFTDSLTVEGSHGIRVICDITVDELDLSDAQCIVFPGGGVGTKNLDNHPKTDDILVYAAEHGILLAAICAAPSILGKRGYLTGHRAVCYPSNEKHLLGAKTVNAKAVRDGKIITAKAAGAAFDFAYAIADTLTDNADRVKKEIYYG